MLRGVLFGEFADVVAVVAVLRELYGVLSLEMLQVAGLDGVGEFVNLVSGVVDVELPLDCRAAGVEDGGEGVAEDAAARVAHVHGPGGVRRDKFNHNFLSAQVLTSPVGIAFCLNCRQGGVVPARAATEIQETGPGDFHALKVRPL